MEPVTMVAVGSAVVGGVSKILGGIGANKERKKVAKEQAKLTYSTRMEEIRRRQKGMAQQEGLAVASAYASNIQGGSGSPAKYINNLRSENSRQVQWAKYAAKKEKEHILEGGQPSGQGLALLGQAASTISNTIGTYNTLTS